MLRDEMLRDLLNNKLQTHPSAPPARSPAQVPVCAPFQPRKRTNEHLCPIATDVMADPVMVVSCGDTFELSAIVLWI